MKLFALLPHDSEKDGKHMFVVAAETEEKAMEAFAEAFKQRIDPEEHYLDWEQFIAGRTLSVVVPGTVLIVAVEGKASV